MDPGPVHRLVPVPLRRRALAPVHGHHRVFTPVGHSLGDAYGMGVLSADHRGLGQDSAFPAGPVTRELTTPGHRVGLLGERAEEDLLRLEPPGQGHAHVPVVGQDPVLFLIQCQCRGHLHRLMARRSDHEWRSALTLQGEEPIVDPPRRQHQPVHLDDLLVAQAQFPVVEVPVEVHAVGAVARQFVSSPLRRNRRRSPISRIRSSATMTAA